MVISYKGFLGEGATSPEHTHVSHLWLYKFLESLTHAPTEVPPPRYEGRFSALRPGGAQARLSMAELWLEWSITIRSNPSSCSSQHWLELDYPAGKRMHLAEEV